MAPDGEVYLRCEGVWINVRKESVERK